MERVGLVVGNWKMELSYKGSVEVALALRKLLKPVRRAVEVVVCPSYPALEAVARELKKTEAIQLGAQNVHWEETGAWTGAVSVTQLKPFVRWCIVGHSEQRAMSGETDEVVAQKALLLLRHGVAPIVCVGETEAQRAAGKAVPVVTEQAETVLAELNRVALMKVVLAYEPIWAIGTGQQPEPAEVTALILLIRKIAAGRFGNEAAARLRVLYGGSVTPRTVGAYVAEPGVDGVLVGGASVHPGQFVEIIDRVQAAPR